MPPRCSPRRSPPDGGGSLASLPLLLLPLPSLAAAARRCCCCRCPAAAGVAFFGGAHPVNRGAPCAPPRLRALGGLEGARRRPRHRRRAVPAKRRWQRAFLVVVPGTFCGAAVGRHGVATLVCVCTPVLTPLLPLLLVCIDAGSGCISTLGELGILQRPPASVLISLGMMMPIPTRPCPGFVLVLLVGACSVVCTPAHAHCRCQCPPHPPHPPFPCPAPCCARLVSVNAAMPAGAAPDAKRANRVSALGAPTRSPLGYARLPLPAATPLPLPPVAPRSPGTPPPHTPPSHHRAPPSPPA